MSPLWHACFLRSLSGYALSKRPKLQFFQGRTTAVRKEETPCIRGLGARSQETVNFGCVSRQNLVSTPPFGHLRSNPNPHFPFLTLTASETQIYLTGWFLLPYNSNDVESVQILRMRKPPFINLSKYFGREHCRKIASNLWKTNLLCFFMVWVRTRGLEWSLIRTIRRSNDIISRYLKEVLYAIEELNERWSRTPPKKKATEGGHISGWALIL
jgi:hypothetical protein